MKAKKGVDKELRELETFMEGKGWGDDAAFGKGRGEGGRRGGGGGGGPRKKQRLQQ